MSHSNFFRRSPRTYPPVPTEDVEIQSPPPKPTRPSSSLAVVLVPLALTILMLLVSVVVLTVNPSYLLFSGMFMLGSGLATIISYVTERHKYRSSFEERGRVYREYLAAQKAELEKLASQQREAALTSDPGFDICLERARRLDPEQSRHLWERSSGLERPRDADFLNLRVGVGKLPPTFHVKLAARPSIGESDELFGEAESLLRKYQEIGDMSVLLPLAQIGTAGISGPRPLVLDHVRSLLVQLATHHAPNELKLIAFLPQGELSEWSWIRWLPHVWDDERKQRYIITTPDEAQKVVPEIYALLKRRSLERSQDDEIKATYPRAYVFLFADPTLSSSVVTAAGPMMHLLLTQGPAIDAYSLFLAERPELLPGASGAVVDIRSGKGSRLRLVGPPTQEIPMIPDRVSLAQADRFARTLAPVRIKHLSTPTDIPSNVPLTMLLGVSQLENYPIARLWQTRDTYQKLEVPLGMEAGGGTVELNFQDAARGGDGSHAMVGGTTGTGKTRFLQTMIVLLAARHHPHDVNFILIDYKGGDLLRGLEGLPHVVGTLANLERQSTQALLIERLFVCLEAELRRRRNLLGGRDINTYQRYALQDKSAEPLPHLFVIIDEFAEMIRNSPDKAAMTKRLLSIGATGRSLGVHLILATQDPSGVVTDELRTNINIRFCLRMGSRQASMDILRLPDAYDNISSSQVGRAYLQVGNNDRFVLFQVAWGGDHYIPGQAAAPPGSEIYEVGLDGHRTPLRSFRSLQAAGETQLAALVKHIQETAKSQGLRRLKSPLSPPLRPVIFLDELRKGEPGWDGNGWQSVSQSSWLSPIVGQLDDPSNQSQDPLRLPLGNEGHFVLYGEPGSGKTTFIKTLVVSLALCYSPEDAHIYLIDSSGQRLLPMKRFPHVGDVFLGDEIERLTRLFRFLRRDLEKRKKEFARVGVSSLSDYRAVTGSAVPAIVIALDDYNAFYKNVSNQKPEVIEVLERLIRDGGNYGLHFVLTMNSPSELQPRLANSISLAATFHLAVRDYAMAIGPTGGMEPSSLPGRGLIKGQPPLEFQTALPVQGNTDAERAMALKALMKRMENVWPPSGAHPRAFAPIPAVIGLSQIVPHSADWPNSPPGEYRSAFALNLDDPETSFEIPLTDGPYFLVAGTPQSGKTTLLLSWALSLAERYSPDKLICYVVDFRHSDLETLSSLPHLNKPVLESRKGVRPRYIWDGDRLGAALGEIASIMQRRKDDFEKAREREGSAFRRSKWLKSLSAIWMLVDDYEILKSDADQADQDILQAHLRKWSSLGFYLTVAGQISEIENGWGWIKLLRDRATGFQMGTAMLNQIFKINLPFNRPDKSLDLGEAFYIRRSRFVRVKVADPRMGPVPLRQWIELIRERALKEVGK